MYIIPAIDILDGKVVRLREGDYAQATYYDVTLEEMIVKYHSKGTEMIHIIHDRQRRSKIRLSYPIINTDWYTVPLFYIFPRTCRRNTFFWVSLV